MSLEKTVSMEKVKEHVGKQITEKVRVMGNEELSKALYNAKKSYELLIQEEEEGEGKLTYRPSEHKEKKRELSVIIEAILQEQEVRKNLQK